MMSQPITITENAAAQINKLLEKAPAGTQGLRLNIKTTGCSGNSYHMEYIRETDDLAKEDSFSQNNATLHIPKIHSWMLFGMVVDYVVDELGNSRFDFSNPNETGRCGCGESFHVDVDKLQKLKETVE
jgi:iron-sulfur cluster assembly protein